MGWIFSRTCFLLIALTTNAFAEKQIDANEKPKEALSQASDKTSTPVEANWDCADSKWLKPPTLEDGVFQSTRTAECVLSGGNEQTLIALAKFIRGDIETSGKLKIHKGPTQLTYQGLPAFKYDVTDDLKQEGSPAVIRQDLVFATDEKTRLVYLAESTDVQGKGMASYLKKVDFLAEVEPGIKPGTYRFRITNAIEVERPWFALGIVFEPIAKNTAVEKFTRAKDKLLAYLAPHIK